MRLDAVESFEPMHDHGRAWRRVLVIVHPDDESADWLIDSQHASHDEAARRMAEINHEDYAGPPYRSPTFVPGPTSHVILWHRPPWWRHPIAWWRRRRPPEWRRES